MQLLLCFIAVAAVAAFSHVYEFTTTQLKRERDLELRITTALAQRDALTGLANRRHFDAYLQQHMASAGALRPAREFALCYLDLGRL